MKYCYQKFVPLRVRDYISGIRWSFKTFFMPNKINTYNSDGFTTTHFLGFRTDDKFNQAFLTAINSIPLDAPITPKQLKNIEWRAHICTWAANQALKVKGGGDFVECGVWYGVLSKTICEYLQMENISDRKFYLVDTFGQMLGSHQSSNYRHDIYEDVKERFSMYPPVELIRGVVPDCLTKIPSSRIAYLSIDMNNSEPELKTLEYFYDKMVPGGIIYFDDYGWEYPELRKVVDRFFSSKPETLLHFPSGNSIVVKL
jgi:O-methyltransferase